VPIGKASLIYAGALLPMCSNKIRRSCDGDSVLTLSVSTMMMLGMVIVGVAVARRRDSTILCHGVLSGSADVVNCGKYNTSTLSIRLLWVLSSVVRVLVDVFSQLVDSW